ncbi:MCE family protein [Umezawaea endophytica]|uniref:MCE family protein n=1 Tax=Umezawaea endophytica TaxID=1654476 RepID=A0A9X3ADZ6_9PSEU|nr:MCE family protein [Umezawaea endophytica]MCS7475395.1 MCE family protein [Umezawaea endophytica]
MRTDADRGLGRWLALGCVFALLAAGALWWVQIGTAGKRITAVFDKAIGVHTGSAVRVLGVQVGVITDVRPRGGQVDVDILVDRDVRVPAEVRAVVVAPSLVSDRYVQLTPAYRDGAELAPGAGIPRERTATPVELDSLYRSLNDLSTALGPNGANADGAVSDLLDAAAANLDGNGQNLNDTVKRLGEAASALDGSKGDLFATVDNLRTFTGALARSDSQVREFSGKVADVSTFLAADSEQAGAALGSLALALTDVQGFIEQNRELLQSNVGRLTGVTKALVDQRGALAEVLDIAPNAASGLLNAYDEASGSIAVRANLNELTYPPVLMACKLLRLTTPKQVPDALASACEQLAPILDGVVRLPSVAEVLAAVQQGKLPPLPLPAMEVWYRGADR